MEVIHPSWKPIFDKPNAFEFFDEIYESNTSLYPEKRNVFRVFSMPVNEIKVVFLGQDPYHGKGQADGLSFSVPKNVKIPPSLKNIFKEILNEYPERNYQFSNGDLTNWFQNEKIFLLNSALFVAEHKPNSFINYWKKFTNEVIKFICENNNKCVFLLLGKHAKSKIDFINDKTRIVEGVHPSPLSAYNGFFDSGIFKQIELKLGENINWQN